jgi:hypothetical protein
VRGGWNKRPVAERLWAKVQKTDDCWLWQGCCSRRRGQKWHGRISDGRKLIAVHRLAYELEVGPIPEGMEVCHSCDVPNCVNPKHLWIGTQAENVADCKAKGRNRWAAVEGERHYKARLSREQVLAIRASAARGVDLAAQYGVSPACISDIRLLRRHKHGA